MGYVLSFVLGVLVGFIACYLTSDAVLDDADFDTVLSEAEMAEDYWEDEP